MLSSAQNLVMIRVVWNFQSMLCDTDIISRFNIFFSKHENPNTIFLIGDGFGFLCFLIFKKHK